MLDNFKTGNIVQQNDYKHIILLCKSSAKVVTISGDKVVTDFWKMVTDGVIFMILVAVTRKWWHVQSLINQGFGVIHPTVYRHGVTTVTSVTTFWWHLWK